MSIVGNALGVRVGKKYYQKNKNDARNIFCFAVFDGFQFFLAHEIYDFDVLPVFDYFTICFATGGASRKLQNHKKREMYQNHKFRKLEKNKNHQKQQNKKYFERNFCFFDSN